MDLWGTDLRAAAGGWTLTLEQLRRIERGEVGGSRSTRGGYAALAYTVGDWTAIARHDWYAERWGGRESERAVSAGLEYRMLEGTPLRCEYRRGPDDPRDSLIVQLGWSVRL
jgi:hypothetical protein